jgi:hypothetical protein
VQVGQVQHAQGGAAGGQHRHVEPAQDEPIPLDQRRVTERGGTGGGEGER